MRLLVVISSEFVMDSEPPLSYLLRASSPSSTSWATPTPPPTTSSHSPSWAVSKTEAMFYYSGHISDASEARLPHEKDALVQAYVFRGVSPVQIGGLSLHSQA